MKTALKSCRLTLLGLLAVIATGCALQPKSAQQTAADEALAARVYSALQADELYYYRHVNVEVDNGVAQLSGYVWTTEAMHRAKQLAGSVPGIVGVINQMELERNGDRGGGHIGTG
ncbi:MAG: BON domain-containing protein [Sinobacteraceae bacterium]|nr:BON domain-containing protein [Nevskiaceae bacterium]